MIVKPLYFATSNNWKFAQAREVFGQKGIILKQFKVDLPESRSEDVYEIAREKANFAYKQLKKPVFTLDAAYFIKTLNGFPKTYIKFADKYIGAQGILKLLKDKKDRRWEFANVICFKDSKEEKIFTKFLKGTVANCLGKDNPRKIRDIDRIFIPEGFKKPYSEFSSREQEDYDQKIWRPTVFGEFIRWLKEEK
jgi:XTP/dITP diphosphohydrolase